ncbi:PREDICTED: uncharacterized protein LOC108371451 isoform X2 [Rhagoletis zephyria]|uniref:uncharacterized protein LOC108371451 isoform X2 n=1 Tax=Rhagoletis zephyria TaxID=28612 RepID=UPI00081126A8|nr:PREDICTED: uncharacterized protein LOC108371451 isoform X2 [Rhagoletis zephyria]
MDDGNEVVTFETVTGLVQQLEASNYHDDLLNFVQQNNLDLMCYTSLIECGYTFEKLKYIDKDDINVIFPNREQTALRSEFRVKLFEWKASQIEADFKELYPEKQFMITSKWAETLPKRTVYYEEHVKDKYYRKLLISVKGITDTNSKDCIYFMLLHSILKPTHRYIIKEGELKVHRKATIQSSVSSSILHITSVNDLQHQMELRRNKSIESKTPIQPFLIVVGSDLLSLTDFYVSFGY